MGGAAESYLQISTVFCAVNCTISTTTLLPDCENSQDNCCSPDPMSCFSYYTCYNNLPLQVFCGPLQSFNEKNLICDNNENACYPKCATRCSTDNYGDPICNDNSGSCCLPNPYNCKYFLTCSNGQIGLGQCPADALFDELHLACLPLNNGTCYQDIPKCQIPCPLQIPCEQDCCGPAAGTCSQSYYRCLNGIRIIATCPNLTSYNNSTLQCDQYSYYDCFAEDSNFAECAPKPTNPSIIYPTISPNIPTGQSVTVNRRLLSKEEFLTAIYSVYKELGERFTVKKEYTKINGV